jgi:hypothetical protein
MLDRRMAKIEAARKPATSGSVECLCLAYLTVDELRELQMLGKRWPGVGAIESIVGPDRERAMALLAFAHDRMGEVARDVRRQRDGERTDGAPMNPVPLTAPREHP